MVRRVVTHVNADGRSGFAHDADVRQVQHVHTPGFAFGVVWSSAEGRVQDPDAAPGRFVPAPGESLALTVTFPPDAVFFDSAFDPGPAVAENLANLPGLAELFEPDAPGMHTTPTVDYVVVLEGTVVLELDEGTATLVPGDVVVQNGTRHAWRVPSDSPATIFVVLTGRAS
ncbi:MAG: cupin domain-containing protein [Candidatus Nanopelagicales bacterium]